MIAAAELISFWLNLATSSVMLICFVGVFILLLMFPESSINAMLVTSFTVFYPDVVKTCNEDFYLK